MFRRRGPTDSVPLHERLRGTGEAKFETRDVLYNLVV